MAETLVQDIGSEPLLKHAARETVGAQKCPVLGGVVLISKIGDGVSGAVFRGQNRNLGRDVAVKVLPYSDDTSERFLRFIAHAKAAKNVKSPRAIEVFDAGDEAGVCYQVVEYFPCLTAEKYLASLKERLKPGLGESALLDLGIAASEGLAAAHAAGLLHLDLRPSCILIPQQNPDAVQAPGVVGTLDFAESKLGDLGLAFNEFIARLLDGTPAETGMPGFMSPEQARGEKDIGKASDVFSMGATLYALLVGQPPFGGLSVESVLDATVEQPIGDIRTWRPDVSRATAKVVEICLRKDPAQRFADAGVLAQALQISRGAMDGVSDIQQIAIKEIEALVRAPVLTEQPTEQTLMLSGAAAEQLAQSSAALPALTQSQAMARPMSTPAQDPALEPTMMAASDMLSDLLKNKVAKDKAAGTLIRPKPPSPEPDDDSERTVMAAPPPGASTQEPTMMYAPPPELAVHGSAMSSAARTPAVNAPEDSESQEKEAWIDPYQAVPAPKKSSAGLLVAALLIIGCGAVAWHQGWLGNAEKPKRLTMTPPSSVPLPPAVNNLAAEARQEAEAKAKLDAEAAEAKARLDRENEARAKQDAEAKALADAKAKEDAESKAKADADAKARAEAEAAALKAQQDEDATKLADAKAKKEAEERAAAEAKAKAGAEAQIAEAALKAKQDEEARVAEAKAKEEAAAKALADAKAKADAEARVKEQEAARLKAQQEQEAKLAAEANARKEADERAAIEAKAKADAEAKAAEAARLKEAEAKAVAEAKAKQDAEAKLAAAKAKKEAEEKAAAEARAKIDEEARRAESSSKKSSPSNLKREISVNLGDGVKMEFVLVPGGAFTMGTDPAALSEMARKANADEKDYADEFPAHPVELKPYYIARTPVTCAQFRHFVAATGYQTSAEKVGAGYILRDRQWQFTAGANWQKPGFSQKDDHPAVMLSWRDCDAFAAWASREAGRKLRLPTESEWEFAARGPADSVYPWGNEWSPRLANHADRKLQPHCLPDWSYSQTDDGYAFTSPVGKFSNASWCGALDMSGNVFQWCSDLYDRYPEKGRAPQLLLEDVDVPADAKRVLRGGSFLYHPMGCRSAARRPASQKSASVEFGCRLAMSAE